MSVPESRLLVLGAGGHGHVVADIARSTKRFESIAFLDDQRVGSDAGPWPIIGQFSDLPREAAVRGTAFALGLGDNQARLHWFEKLTRAGCALPALVHATAALSPDAQLEVACVLMAQSAVNIGAQLGPACIVNTSASVDHDCRLGAGVHLSPGAHLGGNVSVGVGSWVGIGASVRHGIKIGARVTIGAGAAVVGDLHDDCIAMGVPARVR